MRAILDLRELQALQRAGVDATRAGKVDDNIDIRVLRHSLLQAGVNGEKSLFRSPVELLDVVATEGVNHGGNGGGLTAAGVVKVQHSLDSTRLETINERTGGRQRVCK
jgi:hypothetical protein